MNNAALKWELFLLDSYFFSFGYIYAEVGLLNPIVVSFNILRKLHVVFPSGYTDLYSHQQHTRVLFSPFTLSAFVILMFSVVLSFDLHFLDD